MPGQTTTIDKQDAANALDFVSTKLEDFSAKLSGTLEAQRKAIREDWDGDKKALDAEIQKHAKDIEALQQAQSVLKQALVDDELGRATKGARTERKEAAARAAARRLGAQVFRSVEMAVFRKSGLSSPGGKVTVPVKNLWGQDVRAADARALYEGILKAHEAAVKAGGGDKLDLRAVVFDEDAAGSAVIPMYRDGVIENPISIPLIRRLATVLPTTETNTIKGDREKRRLDLVAVVTSTTNAPATVIPVDQTTGFSAEDGFAEVYLDNGTTVELRVLDSVSANALTLTAASSINMPAGSKIFAKRGVNTPEGEPAPQVAEELEKYDIPIYEFSDKLKVQAQKLDDIPWVERYLETRLLSRLAHRVDYNAWYGPGGASNVLGFFNDTGIEQLQRQANETYIDFIVRANYEVMRRNFMPSVCPISYDVHRAICLTKGTDGQYIAWQNVQAGSPPQIHVTRLELANEMAPLSGGTGDWGMCATVYDREEAEVSVGTENDDFSRRRRTMLVTERVGIGYEQPLGLERLNFSTT